MVAGCESDQGHSHGIFPNLLNCKVNLGGLTLQHAQSIASGFVHRGDPVALFTDGRVRICSDKQMTFI